VGGEKVWHYRDPNGNIQGPFSLNQLAKWSSYFPPTLKVWLMIDNEDNSLLLTDILPENLKVLAETKSTNPLTVPGVSSANASNAVSTSPNSAKQFSNNQVLPEPSPNTSSVAGTVHDSGKTVQTNNSSNSIKEYGNNWSPTKSNLGTSSQQSQNNLKEKPVVSSVNTPVPSSLTAPGSQNSSVPAPTPEKMELQRSSNPSTTSVPAPDPNSGTNANKVEETVKPKQVDKQVDQIVTLNNADSIAPSTVLTSTPTPAPAANPTPTPTPMATSILTSPPTSTATDTTTTTTLVDKNSPEKEKNQQSENEYPSPTPPTSDSLVAEPDDAPDESWPEVQVHESTGVEPWVPDPTTTSLDTGTSYPSDCLSPADILLSLSRVADEDLEDGDFLARMEALKKKSRLSDREEKPVIGPGVLDLSVTPVDGSALPETADCSQDSKSVLVVQKETKSTSTGGEVLFLQTDTMRTNSWDKLGDPISTDWSLPSPTPLAPKTSGLGVDSISTSGTTRYYPIGLNYRYKPALTCKQN
jgi:GYF domain